MANAINWFEVPVADAERARKFYDTVLGEPLQPMPGPPGATMYTFPSSDGGAGGCIMQSAGFAPSMQGVKIYLNAQKGLDAALGRVEKAGGKVILPRTDIGEFGFMAHVQDTEGNVVGLHAMTYSSRTASRARARAQRCGPPRRLLPSSEPTRLPACVLPGLPTPAS